MSESISRPPNSVSLPTLASDASVDNTRNLYRAGNELTNNVNSGNEVKNKLTGIVQGAGAGANVAAPHSKFTLFNFNPRNQPQSLEMMAVTHGIYPCGICRGILARKTWRGTWEILHAFCPNPQCRHYQDNGAAQHVSNQHPHAEGQLAIGPNQGPHGQVQMQPTLVGAATGHTTTVTQQPTSPDQCAVQFLLTRYGIYCVAIVLSCAVFFFCDMWSKKDWRPITAILPFAPLFACIKWFQASQGERTPPRNVFGALWTWISAKFDPVDRGVEEVHHLRGRKKKKKKKKKGKKRCRHR